MEKRKSKKQVVQRVLQLLKAKPMTVNEIAVSMNSNWDTVNKSLELLQSIGVVEEDSKDGRKIFKAKEGHLPLRNDTLFGVPLTSEQENVCKMLFMKLRAKWYARNKSYPNRTQMQKMVVKIANKKHLSIPKGWYLFGEVCVLIYDSEKEYLYELKNIPGLDQELDIVVEDISKCANSLEIQKKQYEENNNNLYLIKLKLQEILTEYSFDKETVKALSELAYSFAMTFSRKTDNEDICEVLNAFISTLNQLIVHKTEKELNSIKNLLIDSFTSVWELIAVYNFFDSLVEGSFGYERKTFKNYFNERLKTLNIIAWDYVSEMNSLLPRPHLVDKKSSLLQFKGITYNTKMMSEEERKKLLDDFCMHKSDIFREFNL